MADAFVAKADFSSLQLGISQLLGPARESLARSMAVAGGQVIRDEAKLLAPVGTAEGSSIRPGALRSAIYLAYKPYRSTGKEQVYSVSWNATKAPHGHLLEFGHWQPFVTIKDKDGEWVTTNIRLKSPRWIAAHPFLRPALTGASARARGAMFARGRERLFDLLADPTSAGDDA